MKRMLQFLGMTTCALLAILSPGRLAACGFKAAFSYTSAGCNSVTVSFADKTDTTGIGPFSYYWSFDDGTALDSTHYNPVHIYPPGSYIPSLIIKNRKGCADTVTSPLSISKFELKTFSRDTICWSDARTSGITFYAEPQQSAVFYQWTFGDPNSGAQNVVDYAWTTNHKFTGGPGGAFGGPGLYYVRFLVISSNAACGTNGELDTCFPVYIKGPMAIINLPQPLFPANDSVPPLPIPRSAFVAINQSSNASCTGDSIPYVTYSYVGTYNHVTYGYCNADTLHIVRDTMTDCYGKHKMPFIASITLKPVDSVVVAYKDSIASYKTWFKGSALPKGAYYPPTGTSDRNTMADSNLMTCSLPNLVHFTDNSIKWRMRYAIDDNTSLNVLSPSGSFRDTSKWKNYPYASDSLTYHWSFNDPGGQNCTSSATNHNWNCNFSTLCAPYHYYKGANGTPHSGCQSVYLTVSDHVTGCADSISLALKQGPPNAWWNTQAYCKMTWEMQETGAAPRGVPGDASLPMIGFMLDNQANACSGVSYPFHIDLSQTLPTCGALHWWAVFDSANTVKYKKCGTNDSILDYGFTGDLGPGYSPARNGYPSGAPDAFWDGLPWLGNYWYPQGDTGCKTIGIVLQVGQCYDTAWYHNYICFNRIDPSFNIYNGGKLINDINTKSMTIDSAWECGDNIPAYKDHFWDQIYQTYSSTDPKNPALNICSGHKYSFHYHNLQFVDSSSDAKGHGWICGSANPYNPDSMGVEVYLLPKDTNQTDITSLKYTIARGNYYSNPGYTNNWASWYYDMPVWPDSATLHPFNTVVDSVTQVNENISYIDTTGSNPYIIVHQSGSTIDRPVYHFPFYPAEIDSLKLRGHVTISAGDRRARRISTTCGAAIVLYVHSGYHVLALQVQDLKLSGFGAADSVALPYPGVYTINETISNLEGCVQSAQYVLIYGHFATFDVDGDSLICIGTQVTFHPYIRYWSTNCPTPPGGGPQPVACLNGADDMSGQISDTIDFNPWSYANPTAYRNLLTSGNFANNISKYFPGGYQPETWYWDFGDGSGLTKVPTGAVIKHTYTKPGVYTVAMRTVDDRGCVVTTVRRNLMKVEQVIAKFKVDTLVDTLNYCVPKPIKFINQSYVLGSSYKDKVVVHGKIIDTTIVVDSIASSYWTPGDGSTVKRPGSQGLIYDYLSQGIYSVGLTATTGGGCTNAVTKSRYLRILGPQPHFNIIGSSAGCAPFSVHAHLTSKDPNAEYYTWKLGDAVKVPGFGSESTTNQILAATPLDSFVLISYNATKGKYRLYVVETDTFHNPTTHALETCTDSFPHANDPTQYWVNIYSADAHWRVHLGASGSAAFTNDDQGNSVYSWSFGDGGTAKSASPSYTYAKNGTYTVSCSVTDSAGCNATFDSTIIVQQATGIQENKSPVTLMSMYPNPFHTTTNVQYSLDKTSGLKIELYDMAGKEMCIIKNDREAAGTYQLEINADKYQMAPGIYLLKFTTGDGFVSQRLVVY